MKKRLTEKQAKKELDKRKPEAEKILACKEKTEYVLNAVTDLFDTLKGKSTSIDSLFDNTKTTIELIRSYIKGEYREIPFGLVVSAMAAMIYLISPLDAIPDFIPGIGYLDDIVIITLVFKKGLDIELTKYLEWKTNSNNIPKPNFHRIYT